MLSVLSAWCWALSSLSAQRLPDFPGECAFVWLSVIICLDIFHVRVESNLEENYRNKNRNLFNTNEFVRKNDPQTGLILLNSLSPNVFVHGTLYYMMK